MATEEKLSADERISPESIKQEDEWLPKDLLPSEKHFQEFLMESDPSPSINSEIEHSLTNAEADADSGQEFIPTPQTQENIKSGLMWDQEFLDNDNDVKGIAYVPDDQQRVLASTDLQKASVCLAKKVVKNNKTDRLRNKIYKKKKKAPHRSEDLYKCQLCSRSFKNKGSLTRHKKIHDDNRPHNYECEHCGRKFVEKNRLDRHMIIHVKDRKPKFACHLCEKTFYSKSGLSVHNDRHTGHTYDCKVCEKRYTTKGNLKLHMLIRHTTNKCHLCRKTFETALERDEHTCNHQPPRYTCKLCNKIYASKYSLAHHSTEHTGLPWKCGGCERKFAAPARLRTHIILVHKITDKLIAKKLRIKLEPLPSIAIEIEDSCEAQTYEVPIYQFSNEYELTKTELILEEEFLDDKNDSDGTSYVKEDQQRVLGKDKNSEDKCEEYKCEFCNQVYPSRYALYEHSNEHTGLSWKCIICNKIRTTIYRCREHIIKFHKITDKDIVDEFIQLVTTIKEMKPLSYIKTGTGRMIADPQGAINASKQFQTELLLEEEFLDDKNDSASTAYTRVYQKGDLETADDQQSKDNKAEDNETGEYTKKKSKRTYKLGPRSFKEKTRFNSLYRIHDDNRPRNYACGQCGLKFSNQHSLDKHLITHTIDSKKEFACQLCEKTFYTKPGLELHQRLHTDDIHTCEFCGICFTQKGDLTAHIHRCNSGETSSDSQRYKCEFCSAVYSSRHSLQEHSKEHRGLSWKCAICGENIAKRYMCREHIIRFHRIIDKEAVNKFIQLVTTTKMEPCNLTERENSQTDAQPDAAQRIIANIQPANDAFEHANTEFMLEEEFLDNKKDPDSAHSTEENQHFLPALSGNGHPERGKIEKDSETCEICNEIVLKAFIEEHMSQVHCNEGYQCKVCMQSFDKNSKLTRHMRIHDDNRPRNYACGQCGFKYFTKQSLDRHLISHAKTSKGEKVCHLCERSFINQTGLKIHLRFCGKSLEGIEAASHFQHSRYKCEHCGSTYASKYTLGQHVRFCGKSVKTASELQRYKCEQCERTYSSKKTFAEHSKMHDGLPWKCGFCEKKFPTPSRCRKHILQVHKIADKRAPIVFVRNDRTATEV